MALSTKADSEKKGFRKKNINLCQCLSQITFCTYSSNRHCRCREGKQHKLKKEEQKIVGIVSETEAPATLNS